MTEALKALYHASLDTHSHAVFYRRPLQNHVEGFISGTLSEVRNDSTGFVIGPFDSNKKPRLIQDEIRFNFGEEPFFTFTQNNEFTQKFREAHSLCLTQLSNSHTSFYNEKETNVSTHEAYVLNLVHAKQNIDQGTFKKVVLSQVGKFRYTRKLRVLDIFNSLCIKYPGAFVSLISSPEYGTWVGASPEILLSQEGEKYTTVALAGTKITNGGTIFTSKEMEEQNIIKEYIEGVLSGENIKSMASPLEDFEAGALTHLKTNIIFNSDPGKRLTIAQKLHPTPAVAGFPKESATKYILDNEYYKREIYAGYIGFISAREMHLFVNIRCMQWMPEFALIYAGAGITEASDPEAEWRETENKMQIIASVL